jgi:protein-tyrosine-phosphatase/predicted ATP-grasp superfamily ATP-dependent carboligase
VAKETILILDADSVAGLACVQSLGAAGYECVLSAADDTAPAFASRYAKRRAICPDPLVDVEAFKTWLRAWVGANAIDLIIPTTECTLGPLDAMRNEPEIAKRAAIPSHEALSRALDKEKLRALAAELGISCPASAYVRSLAELDDGRIDEWLREGAAVVKTTVSKQWNGTRAYEFPMAIVKDRDELRAVVAERVKHVPVQVQQWVPGRGVGVEVLARRGEIVLSLAHERLHEVPLTGGGSSYRRTISMPGELYHDAQRLMRALGCHGVAMVEYRVDPKTGRHWLMEINMRFWGSLPLALAAGVDFPRALVEMMLHDKKPGPSLPLHDVYARNLSREVKWMKLVAKRRGNASPYELTRPLGRSLLEWGRILTGTEKIDGAMLADAGPFAREVRRVASAELEWVKQGTTRAIIKRMARQTSITRARRFDRVERVLVLCHGNICRSPYAEHALRARDGGKHEIRSAGFYSVADRESPEDFQRAARRHGVDLSAHRSRVVSEDDLAWADLVILMDERNYKHLRDRFPAFVKKSVWLGALDGGAIEIDDPYGMGDAAAETALARIDRCLDRLASG